MKVRLQFAGILLVLLACLGGCQLPGTTHRDCGPRNDDPQGYLLAICRYVQTHQLDVSPADPTAYQVKRLESRIDAQGRPVVWVFLNCCYLGDNRRD
jgi:hypothetical protein